MKKLAFLSSFFSILLLFTALSGCTNEKTVRSGNLKIKLTDAGEVSALSIKGISVDPSFKAQMLIDGGTSVPVSSKKISKGWEFVKDVSAPGGKCRVKERFFDTGKSIRWEVSVVGDKNPWGAPIRTEIAYSTPGARLWAPWGGPQIKLDDITDSELKSELKLMPDTNRWLNALLPVPFTDALYYFGSPYVTNEVPRIAYCPEYTDLLSIPMACIVDPQKRFGLTVALSIADTIQDIDMKTGADGTIVFGRYYHRIVESNPVNFAVDLIAHEPDWRAGLGWMVDRYKEYFYPVMPHVFDLNGTGAYASNHDMGFDVQKMKDMAFSTNWRASFDFPYMGMFIPPVKNEHVKWFSYRHDSICAAEMNDYAERMKSAGFHVLSYLNLNEFGSGVTYPAPAPTTNNPELWWKNTNDYLYGKLSDAILRVPAEMNLEGCYYPKSVNGGPFYTWGDGIVLDCGVPSYKNFLMEQVRRHLDWLPATDGFCIDRYDWWHYFNEQYDDGISWYEGKPARSLRTSLSEFMDEFVPLMHHAGKVIFVNTHTKRIDLLKGIDGIHDEYTQTEGALNTTAFLALKKPALGWTWNKRAIEKLGIDNFFQKFLYMGVFPMCPFPGNDHSLRPDPWTDQAYLDYGPLMQQMKYRKWVLSPDPITVISRNAKANIFEIPEGYIVPVVYATAEIVELALPVLGSGKWQAEVFYPGEKQPVKSELSRNGRSFTLKIPVKRNCAMVRLISI